MGRVLPSVAATSSGVPTQCLKCGWHEFRCAIRIKYTPDLKDTEW